MTGVWDVGAHHDILAASSRAGLVAQPLATRPVRTARPALPLLAASPLSHPIFYPTNFSLSLRPTPRLPVSDQPTLFLPTPQTLHRPPT
jgi:hypothetical protein